MTTDEKKDSVDPEAVSDNKRVVINRVVLGLLLVAVVAMLVPMLRLFFTPLLLACTFTTLFFPLFTALVKLFRGNRTLGALACCVMLVLGCIIPVYAIGHMVTSQLLHLYQVVEPAVLQLVKGGDTGMLELATRYPFLSWLTQFDFNWQGAALETIKTAGTHLATMVNRTSLGVMELLFGIFLTVFIMFYFFLDGERIVRRVRELLPIKAAYQDMIITRFLLVSRATIKGTLVIALVQGSLGAIILLAFGIKTWLLWGVLMILLALIPMFGAWIVLVPAGVFQIVTGNIWQGVVMLTLSFGVVSTIDNVLRPRLVGHSARMHDLLIFFSTIGGLASFGPVGVITGPVIMAFFISITEMYTIELTGHLG